MIRDRVTLVTTDGGSYDVVGWDGETGEPLIAVRVSAIVDDWQLHSEQFFTPEQESEILKGYELQDEEVMP